MMAKAKLDQKLLDEYNELTDGEPVQPHWKNADLKKANEAIKKARGKAVKAADKVNAKMEKNSIYHKGVTMTDEGKEEMLAQADAESKREETVEVGDEEGVNKKVVFPDQDRPVNKTSEIEVLQSPTQQRQKHRVAFDPEEKIAIRASEDIPRFWYGPAKGGKFYGPYKKGTRLKAPAKIVQILEKGGKV
jgi:hypothetical protein